MTVDVLAYALLVVSVVAGGLSIFAWRPKPAGGEKEAGPLAGYLLAGGTLGRTSVLSLLVSSSFGLNSLFYAAWLGYSLGIYALLVQISWSGSFFLLAKYAATIRTHKSMHHLLGRDFGAITRVIAGLCSLIGMMYFIGWETEIARQTFGNLLASGAAISATVTRTAAILATGTIVACLLYTVLGGLRGNALADKVLNITKLLAVALALYVLCSLAFNTHSFPWRRALLPTWADLMVNLGIFGFVTNVAFNLAWQFVDASSWQSVIAGRQRAPNDARNNVLASGWAIFIVPNLLGTLMGILLHGTSGVTADNIVGQAALIAAKAAPWMTFVAGVMVVACVMSLLDGMFLACAFTLVVDIFFPKQTLDELEERPVRADAILLGVRLGLLGVAAAASWGVRALMSVFQATVFDFVYIVVITQLGLLGPNLIALRGTRHFRRAMWLAIVVSIAVGFLCAWRGSHGADHRWADAAGTITAALSIVLALLLSARRQPTAARDTQPVQVVSR